MAAKTIKGITVEIGGNTTGLGKALKEVEKQSSGLSSNLKAVNKALKLDPTNTVLLAEKQKILADAVNATKEKLETLKSVQDQIQRQYENGDIGRDAYLDFQKELAYTEEQLKDLEEQQKSFGSVTKQVMEEAGRKVTEYGNKVKAVGDKISDAGSKMMPVTATIVGIGTAAAALGSDLEESQNKVDVAFKESAKSVHAFAEISLESFGIAKGTALDMAALFGDMGTSMGLSTWEAAKMSTTLVGLAGDLASFKNVAVDEVQNALKGIFTGETESLKNLGIVMNQTALDAFAMANGFQKTTKDMTEAEKVQLRYAYVLAQTTNAQGDFIRTSDGAANSMRAAKEAIKEAGASIGTILTPYVAMAAQYIAQLLQSFIELPEETKKTILTVAAVVAVIGPLLTIVGKLTSGVGSFLSVAGNLPTLLSSAATAFTSLGGAMGILPWVGIVAGIAAIVASLIWLGTHMDEISVIWKEGWNSMVSDYKKGNEAIVTQTHASHVAQVTAWQSFCENVRATWRSGNEAILSDTHASLNAQVTAVQSFFANILSRVTNWGANMKSKASAAIENVRSAISSGLERVRNLFNFEWSLPHIRLPHFYVSGQFSLNPPQVPSFGVQWFAKGAILDGAQLFGALGNKLLGGGEAGKEAVLPLSGFYSELRNILGSFVQSPGDSGGMTALLGRLDGIYDRLGRLQVLLDTGTLVGEIVDLMDAALGAKQRLAERGV